jgi:hypothetical protein
MTPVQWQSSEDPQAMIRWLADREGSAERLWDFTTECLLRVYDDLPGDDFRRVVRHFQEVGVSGIDDLLVEARRATHQLERRARRCDDDAALALLNAQIGLGSMVFALEFHAPEEAAADVSRRLLEWAPQPEAERRLQAETLRTLFGRSPA